VDQAEGGAAGGDLVKGSLGFLAGGGRVVHVQEGGVDQDDALALRSQLIDE